jgi:hypothetical protein
MFLGISRTRMEFMDFMQVWSRIWWGSYRVMPYCSFAMSTRKGFGGNIFKDYRLELGSKKEKFQFLIFYYVYIDFTNLACLRWYDYQ